MAKHRQQNRVNQTNHTGTSVSVGPDTSDQIQEQAWPSGQRSNAGSIPSYEDIQRRAYQIHEEKGGSDLENWLEAEQVLNKEHQGG